MALEVNRFTSASLDLYQARRGKVTGEKDSNTQKLNQQDGLTEEPIVPMEDESPAALIQRFGESVDEMSSALAQFRNRRDYDKKTGAAGESNFERVLDEDVQAKVYVLLKVSGAEGSNIENLLQQARSLFPDDSDLVLVLRELLKRRGLDEIVKKRLQSLLKHVETHANPRRLSAGINIALKARLFGKKLQLDPALMRESYRDFLESDIREVETYQEWICTYGPEHRIAVVDFMEGALITDIYAQDPSCSNIEFGNLLGRLGQLKLIRSSDYIFIRNVMSNNLTLSFNASEHAWLLFMLCVLQHTENLGDYLHEVFGEKIKIASHTQRSSLLQIVYRACKKLPQQLFYDPEDAVHLAKGFESFAAISYQRELIEMQRRNE